MKYEQFKVALRDIGSITAGLGGIVHQAYLFQTKGSVSEALIAVYVALIGVPGVIGVFSLRSGTGQATTGASSPSPSEPASQPSPSSSSSGT